MIHKKHTIYALAGILLSLNALTQADVLDFMRPEGERQDRSEPTRSLGLGFREYETESGDTRVHWAPLEDITHPGSRREYNKPVSSNRERVQVYDEDYD